MSGSGSGGALGPPTYRPQDLATGDPLNPTTPSIPGTGPTPGAGAEQVTRGFLTVWLSGAHRMDTKAAHAAWVRETSVYGGAGLAAQLELTPFSAIPDAAVVAVRVDVLMKRATATVTLSTGQIVLVTLMDEAAGWRVQSWHAPS